MNQLRTYKAYIGPFGEFHHVAHVAPVRNQSGKHVRAEFPKGNAISPLAQSQRVFHVHVRTHRNKCTPKALSLRTHLCKYSFITYLYTVHEETNMDLVDT